MTQRVAVVVLTYDSADVIDACLRALTASTAPPHGVVVVDNASSDGTGLRVAEHGVPLVQTGENLGWAGGNARGIRWAREGGFTHVALLNPDVVVRPGWIEAALGAMGPGVGGVDFRLDEPEERTSRRPAPAAGDQESPGGTGDGPSDVPMAVEALTGAAMVVPLEVVDQVGLPDPDYFLYCEDLDWSWRMTAAGFRLLRVPFALDHASEASSGPAPRTLLRAWLSMRNTIRLRAKLRPEELGSWLKTLLAYAAKPGIRAGDDAEARLRPYGPIRNLALVAAAVGWNVLHLPATLAARRRDRPMPPGVEPPA